jgi:hypothetical protein
MIKCKICKKKCYKYIWFGPEGSFCDNCVPRFECFECNYFKTKDAALKNFSEKFHIIEKKDNFYYIYDKSPQKRLVPCVDYFCADLESKPL